MVILDKIVAKKRFAVEERKRLISEEELCEKALKLVSNDETNVFKSAMKGQKLSVIGEFKKASPSKGIIVEDFYIEEIRKYYEQLGVDAFSILTEEDFFLGSDNYLKEVTSCSNTPILRKDFIIDFYQLYESKVLGANAVLLIVAVLKEKLELFYNLAKKLKLDVLVEVHNEEELNLALSCGCEIIGINNRNLKNFNTSVDTTKALIDKIPKDKIIISESGISSIKDLKELRAMGVDGVLIGEMFMRNINNKAFVDEYKEFYYGEN